MITVNFFEKEKQIEGFEIFGHAGYDDVGKDIVCSAVTSSIQMTNNGITEILKIKANVNTLENKIKCMLPENDIVNGQVLLKTLKLHLTCLSEDYEETIKLVVMEV